MQPGRLLTITGLLVALSAAGARAEVEDESPVSVSVRLDYMSRYLFSGLAFSTGSVLSPGVSIGYNGFTLNAYSIYDADTDEVSEGGFFADYYHQFGERAGVYAGVANFNYKNFEEPGKWASTYEFNAGLVTSLPGNPALHYARDFSLSEDGQTIRLALSHDVPAGAVTFTGSGNITYNDNYYRTGSNLSHFDLSLSMSAPAGRFTLTPMVTWQHAIADDFENHLVGILTLQGDF
ncbi:MAG: hypothetical protein OXE42_12685 [Gammaproteobacteria bacterium]|nr:hypothetical protein [Gammaproteobacteria bacterium]